MIQTFNNGCVFIPGFANYERDRRPSGGRERNTSVAAVLDGSEQRQGLNSAGFRFLTWRVTTSKRLEGNPLEEAIDAALKAGRACAAEFGKGNPIVGGTVNYVDAREDFVLPAGYLAVWIDGAVYPRVVSSTSTPSSGVRRYNLAVALPSAPAAGSGYVWGLIFGRLEVATLGSVNWVSQEVQLTITEPPATGTLGSSDSCVPAAIPTTGSAFTVCGGATQLTLEWPGECGALAGILRWAPVLMADQYRIKRATASGGPYTTVATVGGATLSYNVDKEVPAYYYIVTAITGTYESAASNEVMVPGVSIERMMRVVQERYMATDGYPGSLTPLYWPDRLIGAPTAGDYPVDGFYANDVATYGDARAAELVAAIADAVNDTWVYRYAVIGDWKGIGEVHEIPLYTEALLGVPDGVEITSNPDDWEDYLITLSTIVCHLQFIRVLMTMEDSATRSGFAQGTHADQQSGLVGTTGTGTYLAYGIASWNADAWTDEGGTASTGLTVPDLDLQMVVGGPGIHISGPGLSVDLGTFGAAYPNNQAVQLFSWRARLQADLWASALGEAKVYIHIKGDAPETFPKPVNEFGSLQPWTNLFPGGLVKTGYITTTDTMPPYPEGAGSTYEQVNLWDSTPPTFTMMTNMYAFWWTHDYVTCWTRSNDPAKGHWTHYP